MLDGRLPACAEAWRPRPPHQDECGDRSPDGEAEDARPPYPSANNAPTAAVGPVRGLPERYPWRYPEVFLAPSDFSPRKRFAPSFLMIWRLRPSARPSAGTSCVITEPEPT